MLFQRVYGAPGERWGLLSGSTLVSLGLHAAAFGVAALAVGTHASQVAETLSEGLVFLAPPPSSAAGPNARQEQLTYTDLAGSGGSAADEGSPIGTDGPRPGEGVRAGSSAAGEPEPLESQSLVSLFEVDADSIYLASQVDNPVAFDSRSAAPTYPDSLRREGVEGQVTAQFVVDTTGRVDVGSFVLLESTHGRFTESVQRALPEMYFRPALLNGRKIRQLVQLPFVFKLQPRDLAPPVVDTVGGMDRVRPDTAAADVAVRRGSLGTGPAIRP